MSIVDELKDKDESEPGEKTLEVEQGDEEYMHEVWAEGEFVDPNRQDEPAIEAKTIAGEDTVDDLLKKKEVIQSDE